MRHTTMTGVLVAAAMGLLVGSPVRAAGPISPLYLTGVQFGGGPSAYRIKVVQGDAVTLAFDEYGNGLSPYQTFESAIAVDSTVRTHGGSLCSGACAPFPKYVAEYALSGAFIGAANLGAIPEASPGQSDYLYDGTTDGTHNYAVGSLSGRVYSFDADWQNPTTLFTLPPTLPSGANALWLGIAYDATDGTLWVSTHNNLPNVVANYTSDGTLLSSFDLNTQYNLATGLGIDPADQTLWVGRDCTIGCPAFAVRLEQYSKQGAPLSISDNYPDLQTFDSLGAEFRFVPVPPTDTPTQTPTATATPTPTDTPTATPTATLAAGCPHLPSNTCYSAGKSIVKLKNNSNPAQRTFAWIWTKGVLPLALGDLGDPVNGSTSYRLCVYDQTGGLPVFKMGAMVGPGGPCGDSQCWRALGSTGVGYKNKAGDADGITKLWLKSGAAGKSKVQLRGGGAFLPLPTPMSETEFFDQDAAVIVQLSASSPANCWSSTFDGSSTKRNDSAQFKAVTP